MADHTGLLALSGCESSGVSLLQEVMHSRGHSPWTGSKGIRPGCVLSKGRATKWAPAGVSSVGGLPSYNCIPRESSCEEEEENTEARAIPPSLKSQESWIQGECSQPAVWWEKQGLWQESHQWFKLCLK